MACFEDLEIIAPGFYGSLVYERTKDKKLIEDWEIKAAFDEKNTEKLKKLLVEKLKAIANYKTNYSNENLYKEIKAFVESIKLLSQAVLAKIDGKINESQTLYEKPKDRKIEILKEDGPNQISVKTSGVIEEIYANLDSK